MPPMSAMSMGATEWDRSRFQRRPMALCDREGLSGSIHGSRLVCLRRIRVIFVLWGFSQPDNPGDGLPLGVKEGSPPAFWPSPEVRTGLIFSVGRVVQAHRTGPFGADPKFDTLPRGSEIPPPKLCCSRALSGRACTRRAQPDHNPGRGLRLRRSQDAPAVVLSCGLWFFMRPWPYKGPRQPKSGWVGPRADRRGAPSWSGPPILDSF